MNGMAINTSSSIRASVQLMISGSSVAGALTTIGPTITVPLSTSFTRLHSSHSSGSKVLNYETKCNCVADPENVIVVHCNSGKGRTGTAICAILLYMGFCDSIDDCLRFDGH